VFTHSRELSSKRAFNSPYILHKKFESFISLYTQMYAQHAITTERLENTFYCKFSAKVIITTSYFGKSLLVSSKICDISVSVKQEIT